MITEENKKKSTKRKRELEKKLLEMKVFEEAIYKKGGKYIGGIDEVGRGPLAGPVVAACVVLDRDFSLLGIDDSKKISEKKRIQLAEMIKKEAIVYGWGLVEEKVIDEINILEATREAMRKAVVMATEKLREKKGEDLSYLLIDGGEMKLGHYPQQSIVQGDCKSVSIAAASILAKVMRDEQMVNYGRIYPGYDFEHNKGYGTKKHYQGLNDYGPCAIHRKSFLKKWNRQRKEGLQGND